MGRTKEEKQANVCRVPARDSPSGSPKQEDFRGRKSLAQRRVKSPSLCCQAEIPLREANRTGVQTLGVKLVVSPSSIGTASCLLDISAACLGRLKLNLSK